MKHQVWPLGVPESGHDVLCLSRCFWVKEVYSFPLEVFPDLEVDEDVGAIRRSDLLENQTMMEGYGRHLQLRSFDGFMSFRACEQYEHILWTVSAAACWSKDWAESAMKEEHRTGIASSTFWISCIYCKAIRVGTHSLLLSWSAPYIAATAVQSHTLFLLLLV